MFNSDFANIDLNGGMMQTQDPVQNNPMMNDIQRNGYDYHFNGEGGHDFGLRGGNSAMGGAMSGGGGGGMEPFASHAQPHEWFNKQMYGGGGGGGGGCATGNCGGDGGAGVPYNNYQGGQGGYGHDMPMQPQHGHQHSGIDKNAIRKAWAHYLAKQEEEGGKGWKGKYDWPSVGINIAGLLVWIWLWSIFGFNKTDGIYSNFIFYAVIGAFIVSSFMSGRKTDKYSSEMDSLNKTEKHLLLIAQIALGMSVFVTAMRSYFNNIDPAQRSLIFTTFSLSFIISFMGLLFVSLPKKNNYVRYYRKLKSVMLNMAIGFMIFGMLNASKSLIRRRPTLSL